MIAANNPLEPVFIILLVVAAVWVIAAIRGLSTESPGATARKRRCPPHDWKTDSQDRLYCANCGNPGFYRKTDEDYHD